MKVFYSDENAVSRWQSHLCRECSLQFCVERPSELEQPALWLDHQGLWLLTRLGRPLRIEAQDIQARLHGSNPLVKACGLRSGGALKVLDPMAGWGLDALVLHGMGATVTLVERQPEAAILLQSLLQRLSYSDIRLEFGDGWKHLNGNAAYDVIYLDPMFPVRKKGALPKQRLQLLADLVTQDPRPLAQWLAAARNTATNRVVMKRRAKDPVLEAPDWQIRARSIRFDVYRTAL